jgi:hypothetical protein
MNDRLANPFRKAPDAPSRPAPPPGGTPKEMVRLYVMALVFLMAIATMVYMKKSSEAKPKKPKNAPGEIDYTLRREPPVDATPEGQEKPDGGPAPKKKAAELQELPKDGVIDFRKLAEPFRDGMDKVAHESPEFIAVLRTMINVVPADGLGRLADPELKADAAYLDPVKHRGSVVRVYGQLVKIYTEPLETTIPENRDHVYLGFMTEYRTNRTVCFYLADKPIDPATGQPVKFTTKQWRDNEFYKDWVEVEGVFLRRYDYTSQYEDDRGRPALARSALLFARNLRVVPAPRMANTRTGYVVGVSVVAVILVAVVLVAGVMTRRYSAGSLKERMKDLRGEKGKPALPKADPEKQLLGAQVPAAPPGGPDAGPPPPPAAPPATPS